MFRWLRDLIAPQCPLCNGRGGFKDYYGEWAECACCDPPEDDHSGSIWRWRLWQFNYRNWMMDRRIDRAMRHEK